MTQWRKNQFAITIFCSADLLRIHPCDALSALVCARTGHYIQSGRRVLERTDSELQPVGRSPLRSHLGTHRRPVGPEAHGATRHGCERALWFSMGFAQNVYQLLALRALLGLLGGFNSVSVALITQSAPRDKVAHVVGTLQAVQILAAGVGPFRRRILANVIGVRYTFFVTGIVMMGSVSACLRSTATPKEQERSKWKPPQSTRLILAAAAVPDDHAGSLLRQHGGPDLRSHRAAVSGRTRDYCHLGRRRRNFSCHVRRSGVGMDVREARRRA